MQLLSAMKIHASIRKESFLSFVLIYYLFTFSSCGSRQKAIETARFLQNQEELYHADNDIAMTVRSLADAIKVGEPLDSVEYDFRGVLTDGQGTPLYTDINGVPGIWDINVLDNGKVSIRNLYLGDLLPSDLELYILESLKLTADNRLPSLADTISNPAKYAINIYALSGGYMKYEVVKDTASNGLEGALVTITLGVSPLPEDGIQIAA